MLLLCMVVLLCLLPLPEFTLQPNLLACRVRFIPIPLISVRKLVWHIASWVGILHFAHPGLYNYTWCGDHL